MKKIKNKLRRINKKIQNIKQVNNGINGRVENKTQKQELKKE